MSDDTVMTAFTEDDLEALEAVLDALPQDGLPMGLSELNGFLTGVILNPDQIMTSQWIPVIWGDNPRQAFASLENAETTINLIMDHYNTIAKMLSDGPQYEAVLAYDVNDPDETLWEPWVEGFMKSIALSPGAWEILTPDNDEEAHASLEFILTLNEVAENTSVFPDHQVDEIDERAPDLIPICVAELNQFSKELRMMSAPMAEDVSMESYTNNVVPFVGRKQGRNDLCKCGSGRKYKHCCGSN